MNGNGEIAPIKFGSRRIGTGSPVVTIAEIGINHEGDVGACKAMIELAGEAGADAIKLQTVDPDENYVRGTESYKLFSSCPLTDDETGQMFDLGRHLGMEVLTTAGDIATLEWVEELSPAAHKISSGLFTHLPLIRRAAETGRTLLMSTGAASAEEIDETVGYARASGGQDIGLFQCTSLYPAPIATLNLANLPWMAKRYHLPVGFSDHTDGIVAACHAVAAGAVMVEKHFTYDKSRPGFDHRLSIEHEEFAAMISGIRDAETMMGVPGKSLEGAELNAAGELHRILVARCGIEKGEAFTISNLAVKRPLPGKLGLAPKYFDLVLGNKASKALQRDEPVTAEIAGL